MNNKILFLLTVSFLVSNCAMLFQVTREDYMDYNVKRFESKVGENAQVCDLEDDFNLHCKSFLIKSEKHNDAYVLLSNARYSYDSCYYATKFDKYRGYSFNDVRPVLKKTCRSFEQAYRQSIIDFEDAYAAIESDARKEKVAKAINDAEANNGVEVCPSIGDKSCGEYYQLFNGQSNYDERSTNEELMRIYKELQTYKVNYASLGEKYKAERSESKKRRLERDAKGLVRDYGHRYENFVDTYERASRRFKQKKAEQDARNEAIAAAEKKIAQEKNRFISGPVSTVKIGSRVWTARNLLLAEGGCPEFIVKKDYKSYLICEKSRVDFYGKIQYDDCRGSYTMAQIKEKEWESCQKTGGLYTWSEAENACPDGFRLPTMEEVSTDLKKIEEDYDLQDKLFGDVTQKHADISFWTSTKLGVNYTVKYNLWWSNNNGLVHQNHFVTREAIAGVRCVKE